MLLAVDEAGFPPALERQVRAIAHDIVSTLDPGTRVAFLTLPLPSARIAFTTDRASLGREIERLAGRGASEALAGGAAAVQPPAEPEPADRPGRERAQEADARAAQPPRDPSGNDPDPAAALAPLHRVLANLRGTPGPKSVILMSAATPNRREARASEATGALAPLAAAAVAARAAIHVVVLPHADPASDAPAWIDDLSSATGGTRVDARRGAGAPVRALAQALAGAYTLEVEADSAERDPRAHALSVSSPAGDRRVLAARRVQARGDPASPAPAQPLPVQTPPEPAAPPPAPAASPARPARPADPELDALLARAASYFTDYAKALASVVAEEDYLQRHNRALSIVSVLGEGLGAGSDYAIRERHLKSDFLLVRTTEASAWVPFRDVFEVDGKAVRDREDRLRKLFLETPATAAVNQAQQIMREGARYNLGDVARTINIPTLPLMFVDPRQQSRFSWKRQGEQTVEGTRTRRLDYEELQRPTLVRTSRGGDVPLSGTLWIDPSTGRLVKGVVRAAQQKGSSMEMTVTFRPNEALGVWVPAEMKEFYQYPGQTLDATAKYSAFRRFQVKTEATIAVPK